MPQRVTLPASHACLHWCPKHVYNTLRNVRNLPSTPINHNLLNEMDDILSDSVIHCAMLPALLVTPFDNGVLVLIYKVCFGL